MLAGTLALLAQPPGFDHLAARLPLIGMTAIHRHQRLQVWAAFCLSYLAACQIDRWRQAQVRPPALLLAGATVMALVAAAYLANPNPHALEHDASGLWAGAWARSDFRTGWLGVQLATLLAGIGCVALAATAAAAASADRQRRVPPWAAAIARRAPWALIFILAGELLAFYVPANPPNDARLAFPRLPAVRFLQTHAGDDRIVGTPTVLPANFASVYGLSDVRVDDPSGPFAYQRATSFLDHGILEPRFGRFGHPLYDFLGVRYVISRPGARLPLTRVYTDKTAWIWERPHPLDRLFLPERAIATGEESWESWLDANPDFGFRVLLEPGSSANVSARHWRAADPDASHLEDPILIGASWVHATGVCAEPRLLAAGIYQDGGWQVLAAGRPLAPIRVNGAFVGAWLPAGQGSVDLLYRPPAHSCGCILAALALAAGAAWWVRPPPRVRSPSPSPRRSAPYRAERPPSPIPSAPGH